MKVILIQDLRPGLVPGVEVQFPDTVAAYIENYFEWTGSSLTACFGSHQISGGVLRAWKHQPVFNEIEYHVDAEMFYFVSGTAIMPFMDMVDGQPDLSTAQIVRIPPGTQIIIPPGKAHFVAVAESDTPVEIIVVSPKMDAPRAPLPDPILGVRETP